MTEGSSLLVAALENEGVGRIGGSKKCPDIVDSLQPGAFRAATYGRLTGKPGIFISALGPGMLNFCFLEADCS